MKARFGTVILGALLFAAAPIFASGVNIDFSLPTTISGDMATYAVGGNTVTATGYQCTDGTLSSGCSTSGLDLFAKTGGAGETGLGITNNGDNEIQFNQFIQLDFSQLASFGITQMTFQIESVQDGEGFRLFESNTAGAAGSSPTLTVTGNGSNNPGSITTSTVTVDFAKDKYIDISATNDCNSDVLIGTATSPTPEPGTLALFGSGLLLLGFGLRRRFASHSA